jgi:cation diffusion facilitator CzcD-associated flavoprotein CzcO
MERQSDVLIVGAGPAGLAAAACLAQRGVEHILLEQGAEPGACWANYYDRLRLHTVRRLSGLPFHPIPARYGQYITRDQLTTYLRDYATARRLGVHAGEEAVRARRDGDSGWVVEIPDATYRARTLITATGIFRNPIRPRFPGMDAFGGSMIHSADYRNAAPYAGQRVLVVGAGNSGAEIALDLATTAAHVGIAIRNGVNIVPRDLLGIGIQRWAILVASLPPGVTRTIAPPLLARSVARQRAAGIPRSPRGVLEGGDGRVPVIGLGLIDAARAGRVTIHPGVERFEPGHVRFQDAVAAPYDAVVLATGFRPALDFLADAITRDAAGFPARVGQRSAEHPDLFFAGLNYSFAGTLNNIRRESPGLAAAVTTALVRGRAQAHVTA